MREQRGSYAWLASFGFEQMSPAWVNLLQRRREVLLRQFHRLAERGTLGTFPSFALAGTPSDTGFVRRVLPSHHAFPSTGAKPR